MPNNLSSNVTNKVARVFLEEFEKARVISKTVNTSLISSEFTPQLGETVRLKRPHQYRSIRTPGGDISAATKNSIISGSAPATVQDYITVPIEWTNREEALQLDQLAEIIRPAAQQVAIDLDTDFSRFVAYRSGLHSGTVGTPIAQWGDVASVGSLMDSIGVPQSGERYAVMNPYAIQALADTQSGLGSGSNSLVDTAWEKARIQKNFGGLIALTSPNLPEVQLGATTDRIGFVVSAPDQTYVTAKDTMTQTVTIGGLTNSTTNALRAGDVIKVTQSGRSMLNIRNRQVAYANGSPIPFYWKVVTGGNTNGSGEVTVTVTAAALNEANGQYNNISSAIATNDTVEILGSANQFMQPSFFYHKDAFGIGTIKLPKLHTWDTLATTDDGLSIRVTKYANGDANTNQIRFDLLPAYACLNPLFAGLFHG